MRLLLRFEGHTSWSLPQTDQNIQKLVAYLNTNRVTYSREIGEYGSFQIEITRPDLLPFLSFLKEQLKAPDGCLHFPYQTLCVNGEGKFELIEYFPDGMHVDKFAQSVWNRNVSFPKVDSLGQMKTARNQNNPLKSKLSKANIPKYFFGYFFKLQKANEVKYSLSYNSSFSLQKRSKDSGKELSS